MNKNLFSFLRGRLRTKKEKRKKGEEANEVFVSFFGKQTRNMGLRRFPDFEVGFGRFITFLILCDQMQSFHSFEVGFGLKALPVEVRVLVCFHSFEVGFGQIIDGLVEEMSRKVFIPSR